MKTMPKIYEQFAKLILEEGTNQKFTDICARLGVSPVSLDEYLLEETGKTGEEYMAGL